MAGPKKCAAAHPIHVNKPRTKFGWISSNGLGGDSVKDGQRLMQYPHRFFKKGVGIINFTVQFQYLTLT